MQWTHIFSYDITLDGVKHKLAGTHGPAIISGDTGNPKDRGQITAQWEGGPWTVTAMWNYVGKFDLTDPSNGINNCTDGANAVRRESVCRSDAAVAVLQCEGIQLYQFERSIRDQQSLDADRVGGQSVRPATACRPEYVCRWGGNNNQPVGGAPYNPSMHQVGAVGRFWSLGFQYTFN